MAIEETKSEVQQIIDNPESPDFANTIIALDLAGEKLERIKAIFFNLNSAETSDEMQEIAQEIAPKLSDLGNDISLNEQLFARIKEVHNQKDNLVLNAEESNLLEKTYRRFVRSGANLNEADKAKYREITKELSTLGLQYQQNVLAETNAYELLITDENDLSGLPASVIELAAQTAQSKEKQGWLFNLQYPSYFPFLKYADNRSLREQIFRASSSRANHDNENDNKAIIKRLVELRLEKANLLGFKTHAEYKLQERMAETPEKVIGFLDELHQKSKPFALKEFAEVKEYAEKAGFEGTIQRWDWAYYSEKLKSEKYDYTDEEVKPYLQLEKVISGVFQLAQKLYGLGLKENKSIEVYHPDVMAYEVYNEKEEFIAVLYLDFFPRESKRSGAWMTDYRTQSNVNGNSVRPHVSLVTNFSKSTETTPSLLTFDEVTTFLHEFWARFAWHAVAMPVSRNIGDQRGTGILWNCLRRLHENWAYEKEWLDTFAVHFQTGEKMPHGTDSENTESAKLSGGLHDGTPIEFCHARYGISSQRLPSDADLKAFEMGAIASTDLFEPVAESFAKHLIFAYFFGRIRCRLLQLQMG